MTRIDSFKEHLNSKKAVKVIAGIDNFDIDNIKKVVRAAEAANASAIDICADKIYDRYAFVRIFNCSV